MLIALVLVFAFPVLSIVAWGLLARRAHRLDPYRQLGIVESHRVVRRDTGQEYER